MTTHCARAGSDAIPESNKKAVIRIRRFIGNPPLV
jgi:hypothetical protein